MKHTINAYILKFRNRKLLMAVLAAFVIFSSFGQQFTANQEHCKRDTLQYYWHDATMDEYTDFIPEDCYMELYFVDGKLKKGFFWGTTDEFDLGREGYECGYFVLPMTGIQQGSDSVLFKLSPFQTEHNENINTFVRAPVSRNIRSWKEALSRYQTWDDIRGGAFEKEILYSISFVKKTTSNYLHMNDSIIVRNLTNDSWTKRTFLRVRNIHDFYNER